jgi:hypothetical protein
MQRKPLCAQRCAVCRSTFALFSAVPPAIFASKCEVLLRSLDLYCPGLYRAGLYCPGLYCPGIGGRSAKKPVTADSKSARLRSGDRSLEVSTVNRLPGIRLASSSA